MSKAHKGWYAVHEEAIRTIERTFDREGARRKAIAAYHALLRIENIEGNSTFSRSINSIAKDMNYSYPHAAEALRLLQAAKLCKIEEQFIAGSKERSPSIYTVLPVSTNCSKGVSTNCSKVSTDSEIACRSETSQELPQELLQELPNNSSNGSKNRPSQQPSSRIQLVDDEHIQSLKKIFQPQDVEKAVARLKGWLLTPKGKNKAFTKRRLDTFLKDAEPLTPSARKSCL